MTTLARAASPDTGARSRRLRQPEQRPHAGLDRGRLRVRRAGRDGPGRDALRARGRSGRGRRAAVFGRCRSAAADVNTTSAQVSEARERLRRLEAAAAAQRRDRRDGSAGEARRGDAAALDRGVRAPAAVDRQEPSARRPHSTPRRRISIATRRRLDEVRRQMAVGTALCARGGHRGRASGARGRGGAEELGRDQAGAPQAGLAGERRRAADLLPAGRDGAGRPARALDPAARQHQGALLRRRAVCCRRSRSAIQSRSPATAAPSRSLRA